jgi:selenocysteine lyase/cysteine desulfurase
MDAPSLRAEFPVCETKAYLNAGTCGPLARAATKAFVETAQHASAEGRASGYYERFMQARGELRERYAGVLGGAPEDVAVTTSTSEGIARVLVGLDLREGDEVLTAEYEHPGLHGPLIAARERFGITIREVPLARLADEAGSDTKLVACSHVSWTDGALAPAFADVGREIPVLLDAAQGAGAIPVDLDALGCAFYAASGQKWMCGPVGTGMLWIAPRWRDAVSPALPVYPNLEDTSLGLKTRPWPDARAHDAGSIPLESVEASIAAHDVLAAFGWDAVHERAIALAAQLADMLRDAGRDVLDRGETTLVSWRSDDAEGETLRAREQGVVVRSFADCPSCAPRSARGTTSPTSRGWWRSHDRSACTGSDRHDPRHVRRARRPRGACQGRLGQGHVHRDPRGRRAVPGAVPDG